MITNQRSAGVLAWLTSLYVLSVLLAWALSQSQIVFLQGPPASLTADGALHPLNVGQMSLTIPFLFLALFFNTLANEFFGFRTSLFMSMGALTALAGLWAFIRFFQFIPYLEGARDLGAVPLMFFDMSFQLLTTLSLTVFFGFGLFGFCYTLFKKITKGSFYIVRFFLVYVTGLALVAGLAGFYKMYPSFYLGPWLAESLTLYLQWVVLFLVLMPFHYVLKWPLEIFVGASQRAVIKQSLPKQAPASTPQAAAPSLPLPLFSEPMQESSEALDSSDESDTVNPFRLHSTPQQ